GRLARSRGTCHRGSTRGRKLAATGIGRKLDGHTACQACRHFITQARQLRISYQLVRDLSRTLRRRASQGHCAVLWRAQRSRRGRDHARWHRGRRGLRAIGRIARCRPEIRACNVADRAPAGCHAGRPRQASIGAARQADVFELAAQGRAIVAGRCRPVAGNSYRLFDPARLIAAGKAGRHDQWRADQAHRRRADCSRDLERGRRPVRRTRRRFHDPPFARCIRRRRNARLGGADRRLSPAGLFCDGSCGREGRVEMANSEWPIASRALAIHYSPLAIRVSAARSRLGLIARGAMAISAATAPSANGPAFEAPATNPPNGPPTATPRSHADVTAPKAAVRSRGSAASVTMLVTLGISMESPAPAIAVEVKAIHSVCVRDSPASPADSIRKAERRTRLPPKRAAYPLPTKRVIMNAMPKTVSAKFWPAKSSAAKRGTRNAAMTP